MTRLLAILILIICFLTVPAKAVKYALVIGIGDYPTESGWRSINGDDDISIVKEFLIQNDFKEENIRTIINQEATFKNILTAIDELCTTAHKNDVVYIHFSGHGQLITDINGDEESGFDEAWVPYDAYRVYTKNVYEGQYHLVDDILNEKLHLLRTRIGALGKIIVVADACHSGGGSRDEEDIVFRGSKDTFVIPMTTNFIKSNKAEDWVYISACKSYQFNQQCLSHPYGSLSYAMYLLRNDFASLSAGEIVNKIRSILPTLVKYSQTPEINSPSHYLEATLF